jgi:feruloyl-CoA synthase
VQDVVVTGPDRQRIGLLVFPSLPACRELAGLGPEASAEAVLAAPALKAWLAGLLASLNREATGLASHIAWACPMVEPPSLDAGEITDKGSLNQRAVLSRRSALIDRLYDDPARHCVMAEAGA